MMPGPAGWRTFQFVLLCSSEKTNFCRKSIQTVNKQTKTKTMNNCIFLNIPWAYIYFISSELIFNMNSYVLVRIKCKLADAYWM